jgi:hypothetical protein
MDADGPNDCNRQHGHGRTRKGASLNPPRIAGRTERDMRPDPRCTNNHGARSGRQNRTLLEGAVASPRRAKPIAERSLKESDPSLLPKANRRHLSSVLWPSVDGRGAKDFEHSSLNMRVTVRPSFPRGSAVNPGKHREGSQSPVYLSLLLENRYANSSGFYPHINADGAPGRIERFPKSDHFGNFARQDASTCDLFDMILFGSSKCLIRRPQAPAPFQNT